MITHMSYFCCRITASAWRSVINIMKKIFITGSAGFVGRNLAARLVNRYEVVPLKRSDINLLDEKSVKDFFHKHQPDILFHCASHGGSRVTGYDNGDSDITMNNQRMFFNLRSALPDNAVMVSFGSGAAYNKKRDLVKVKEEEIGLTLPEDGYGFSKFVIHQFIEKSENVISPIIFGLFGKYENYAFKFISNAIIKNLFHLPIAINQNVIFDYLYMDDFLNIMELFVENNYDVKTFNITPSQSVDLVSVCNIINDVSSYKSEIIIKNEGMNFQYTGDNTQMLAAIGSYEFMPLAESLAHLCEYYKSIINDIDKKEIATDEYIKYCRVK